MKLNIITPQEYRAAVRTIKKGGMELNYRFNEMHLRPLEAATMLRFQAKHVFRPTAYHIDHKHLDKYVLQPQGGKVREGLSIWNQTRLALYCLKQQQEFTLLSDDNVKLECVRLFVGSNNEQAFTRAYAVIGSEQHKLKFLDRAAWVQAHVILRGEFYRTTATSQGFQA